MYKSLSCAAVAMLAMSQPLLAQSGYEFLKLYDERLELQNFRGVCPRSLIQIQRSDVVNRSGEVGLHCPAAVSNASWFSVVVLATLPSLPFNYPTIMGFYAIFLGVTITGVFILRNKLL